MLYLYTIRQSLECQGINKQGNKKNLESNNRFRRQTKNRHSWRFLKP